MEKLARNCLKITTFIKSLLFGVNFHKFCHILSSSKKSRQGVRIKFPTGSYMFKVNNRNTRRCEICSKLTVKTPE